MIGTAGDAEAAAALVAELRRAGLDAEALVRPARTFEELRSLVDSAPVERRPIFLLSRHSMAAIGSLVALDEFLSTRRPDGTAVKGAIVTGPDESEETARQVAAVRGAWPVPGFVAALTAKPFVSEESWKEASNEVGAEFRRFGDVVRLILLLLLSVFGCFSDRAGLGSWTAVVLALAILGNLVVRARGKNRGS